MRFNLPRQFCISHWKVTSVLQSSKGMQLQFKKPQITYCEGNVLLQHLFHLYLPESRFEIQAGKMSSTYQTLQYLLYSRQGVGVLFVQVFRWQKLIQNCKPPFFFHTNTTVLHQALWLGLMAPDSNISHRWLLTSSTNGGGIHLNHSLKGVSLVTFIVCSVEWVQPNSSGSNENTSWYSVKSQRAASASSGVQESRLLKSNSSNNLPCHCLTVSLEVWESQDSSAPSSNCSLSGRFRHRWCSYCPGHRGFLSEGLQVCCVIPHHHDCFFTAFPQLGIHVLHSETLWQGAILCS